MIAIKLHSYSAFLFGVTLLCYTRLQVVLAECNVCLVANDQACVSVNEYQSCINGRPSGFIYTCNPGKVCTTAARCESNSSDVVLPCADCRTCNENNMFACLNTRQFALCLGGSQPTNIIGECETGNFCNINNPYICAPADSGFPPTCSHDTDPIETTTTTTTSSTTTTTPSPGGQPSLYCRSVGSSGRFPVGNDLTTTCKQYLVCLNHNGTWIGSVYYCPNNFYFDDTTRACLSTPPPRCSGRIRSLSINGIELN